jgi:apolipoprotein N-acyltransferase
VGYFVPLLFVSSYTENPFLFFVYSYLTMLIWNTGTTWWIWNSTGIGAIAAIIANSLLMTLPWYGYRIYNRKYRHLIGFVSLIVFWMSFEYIHLNWQLSWPWLTLGNVFAMHPNWVQWYEVTGTSGGTLWVLIINIILFQIIREAISRRYNGKIITSALLFLVTPFLISGLILNHLQTSGAKLRAKHNVVIVQPNINPYNEKFAISSLSKQINLLISLSERQLDTNTALVIWPETALSEIQNSLLYKPVFDFINRHPRRYVARSANTGISAVIDEKGQILQSRPWNRAAFIKANIPALTNITFYVKWGDILSKVALITCLLLIVFHIFIQFKESLRERIS